MKDILVIGDSCRDVYVYCETNRLAPDVPVPVLNVLYQNENGEKFVSLISPDQWNNKYSCFGSFKLDTDFSWKRINK